MRRRVTQLGNSIRRKTGRRFSHQSVAPYSIFRGSFLPYALEHGTEKERRLRCDSCRHFCVPVPFLYADMI